MPRFKAGDGICITDGPLETAHWDLNPLRTEFGTLFPNNELPYGGSGWLHGFSDGNLWNNIRTTPGKAFGTQINGGAAFVDGIAHLNGVWGNDQSITAIASVSNTLSNTDSLAGLEEELELLFRFGISQSQAIGYEVTFSVDPNVTNGRYVQLNRWNGPSGGFTLLASGASTLVANNAVIFASIVGTVFTVTVNGTPVGGAFPYDTVGDSIKYAKGAPGIGHYYFNSNSVGTYAASDYGLSSFAVTAQ